MAEQPPSLLDMIDEPRQRNAQSIGVIQAVDSDVARFAERLIDAPRRPWMGAVDVLAQHYDVHDRKNPCAAVVFLLDELVVGKQPRDQRRTSQEQLRDIEREQSVELTSRKHLFQSAPA